MKRDKWLAEADNRYVRWTKECNMTREQAKIIYYYDVTVRGEMLMPNCRVPLTEYIVRLDTLIPKGDEKAVRDILKNVRKRLLYWEYIRQANWYDAGPLADVLRPLQLGTLWGKCIFGNMLKKYSNSSWKQWNVDLAQLGVDLQNVTTLSIGIDDNGAGGTLYIDDIGLYSLREQQTN